MSGNMKNNENDQRSRRFNLEDNKRKEQGFKMYKEGSLSEI